MIMVGAYASGAVAYDVDGFTVDAQERVYIGSKTGIDVYQGQEHIDRLYCPAPRAYSFTIEGDRLIAYNSSYMDTMTLNGEKISRQPVEHGEFDRYHRNRAFTSQDGTRYYLKGGVIVPLRVLRDDGAVIYTGPLFDSIFNFAAIVMFITVFVCIPVIVFGLKKYEAEKNKRAQ